eukprot:30980-Pelagococcus_subviridis.AAC.2
MGVTSGISSSTFDGAAAAAMAAAAASLARSPRSLARYHCAPTAALMNPTCGRYSGGVAKASSIGVFIVVSAAGGSFASFASRGGDPGGDANGEDGSSFRGGAGAGDVARGGGGSRSRSGGVRTSRGGDPSRRSISTSTRGRSGVRAVSGGSFRGSSTATDSAIRGPGNLAARFMIADEDKTSLTFCVSIAPITLSSTLPPHASRCSRRSPSAVLARAKNIPVFRAHSSLSSLP